MMKCKGTHKGLYRAADSTIHYEKQIMTWLKLPFIMLYYYVHGSWTKVSNDQWWLLIIARIYMFLPNIWK